MNRRSTLKIATLLFFAIGLTGAQAQTPTTRSGLDAARGIVDAVNAKNSSLYVRDLAVDVVVRMYGGKVRLEGRAAVKANREAHFKNFPGARNKLVHLVEIGNRVVMHDQVWLVEDQAEPANIVEVFTFEDGKIVQIDVIQPNDLFQR